MEGGGRGVDEGGRGVEGGGLGVDRGGRLTLKKDANKILNENLVL